MTIAEVVAKYGKNASARRDAYAPHLLNIVAPITPFCGKVGTAKTRLLDIVKG